MGYRYSKAQLDGINKLHGQFIKIHDQFIDDDDLSDFRLSASIKIHYGDMSPSSVVSAIECDEDGIYFEDAGW